MEKQKIRDEIDFKELLKSPLRLYGWFFVYFFVILLAFGIFFGHKLIQISFNEQNVSAPDISNIKLDLDEKKGGITPAVDLNSVKNPTAEMIAKGKELYDANCKSCHGDNGLGDGPAGLLLNPKPRNFHETEGWTVGRILDALYKTLQEGILSRGMAAYEYLPPSDRFNIIHYIRTLADYPEITDEQIEQLNAQYNLSAGTVQPNQIPVEKAISKILDENLDIQARIAVAKTRIEESKSDQGAVLLLSYSNSLDRILYSFAGSSFGSFEKYHQFVKNAPLNFGFNPSIVRVTDSEMRLIYEYLNSIMI